MDHRPEHPGDRGAVRRRAGRAWFGPAALAAAFCVVLGGLLWMLHSRWIRQERTDLSNQSNTAREAVEDHLDAGQAYLEMLADDLSRRAIDEELFARRVWGYIGDHPEIRRAMHVGVDGEVMWAAPRADQPVATGRLPGGEPMETFLRTRETHQPAWSKPFVTVEGDTGVQLHVPVYRSGEFLGTFAALYSFQGILRNALPREVIRNHRVSIVAADGARVAALPGGNETDPRLVARAPLSPPGGVELLLERYGSGFWGLGLTALALLCVGLTLGMAWGMWSLSCRVSELAETQRSLRHARDELAERVRERTADLEQANDQLQEEIAERHRAEEMERRHREQLAHVARVSTMGEMAAGLAHELNQPLGAIASYAEGCRRMLDQSDVGPERMHEAMEEMSRQARRAGRIIHRLRSFVSKSAPNKAEADLHRLTGEVVDLLGSELRAGEVDLRVDVPRDLPPVLVDRIQIQQVLLNLMRNGVEAMRRSDAPPRLLRVTASTDGEARVAVDVTDTGGGEDVDLRKIFDAFYTTKETGLGMGLSISRSIVEAHGGELKARANPGGGLTLRFTLPAREDEPT